MPDAPASSMSVLLQQLHTCAAAQERELAALRRQIDRLRGEREELLAQLRFISEQANREARAAGSLRAQLLERTSVPKERLDFCCRDEWGETTAVLPTPRAVRRPRTRRHRDDTEPGLRPA